MIVGALEEQRKQFEEEIEKLRRNTPIDQTQDTISGIDGRASLTTSGYGSRMSDREDSSLNLYEERSFGHADMQFLERYDSVNNCRKYGRIPTQRDSQWLLLHKGHSGLY